MSPAAGVGSPSPLIAGAEDPLHGGEFNDITDDGFDSSTLFNFNNSPDTLQSLDTARKSDGQSFTSPKRLRSGQFASSPNGSYHEYSSDSADSSKREGQTPGSNEDVSMDERIDATLEWNDTPEYPNFAEDETFTTETDAPPPGIDGLFDTAWNPDGFIDRSMDFDAVLSSPNAPSAHTTSMASPAMPTIGHSSPRRAPSTHSAPPDHQRQDSVYSLDASMNGLQANSREVSPMTNWVTSQGSSPAAVFHTPSPRNTANASSGEVMWPNAHVRGGPVPHPIQQMQQSFLYTPQAPMPFVPPAAPAPEPRYELSILSAPTKSRVETQIPIKMILAPVPHGVTKLHLPPHTISKPKLQVRPTPQLSPDTLELSVSLVCTSAMQQPELKEKALQRAASHPQRYLPPRNEEEEHSPQNGADVRICSGCIVRERKRAARKKVKKLDEEKSWTQDEELRVVVFNTHEVKEWEPLKNVIDSKGQAQPAVPNGAMQVDAPLRIACYCRHHGEKMGFNVIFTIKNYKGKLIAQAMSHPIMITDDHKTHPVGSMNAQSSVSESSASASATAAPPVAQMHAPVPDNANFVAPVPNEMYNMSPASAPDLMSPQALTGRSPPSVGQVRPLSRPNSPSQCGPVAKKRKASATRVPNGLAMTRLETTPPPVSFNPAAQQPTTMSPFTPNLNFTQADQLFAQATGADPFGTNPPTPNANDPIPFFGNHRSTSFDNLSMAHMFSAPPSNHSNHPSRAPSPNGLRANNSQNQLTLPNGLMPMPLAANQPRVPPVIHKIIPNEGPRVGGIEVTILGTAFFQGLDVYFGNQKATTTTFWGESSLVCLLPPSPITGTVKVTCQHDTAHGSQGMSISNNQATFRYIDDTENQLMRMALACLGGKMNGRDLDISDVARQVLEKHHGSRAGSASGEPSGGPAYNHASFDSMEVQLLKCLDVIDLDDSPYPAPLDKKGSTGHTMLHLACSLGYRRLVAALLARGASPNALDNGNFTPLHMASINDQSEIARRLMLAGANSALRSMSGLTALDMRRSDAIYRAIRYSERHSRSQSRDSLRSRASSASSLHSLWEPMTRVVMHDEPDVVDSGEESPEYTTGDFEDEDPDEDVYLQMRRPSTFRQELEGSNEGRHGPIEVEDDPETSPTARAAALKDQFQQQIQQIQQSMALHFQNFPHLPHLPQFPQMPTLTGMPVFPDYQAYLQQAPLMRRMTQYMPGMSGSRPPSEDGGSPKLDNRWWDLSSYMSNATVPPPSYEEIFPQDDRDTKQASVAQAAADAEADMKCAKLYDQEITTQASSTVRDTRKPEVGEVPSVLKIGRKNAITREQQEQFLRAHEMRRKRNTKDRNLFFIWIPLLVTMICAMIYSYFPGAFHSIFALVASGVNRWPLQGHDQVNQMPTGEPARVEVVEFN